VSVGNAAAPNSLAKLTNPAGVAGVYGGFPDFSTNKLVHDTLGGEHRLTTDFYKRDVVTKANSDLVPAAKYTSWIAQYTMQDYDKATSTWVTSGHRESSTPGAASADAGQIFEMRFDTNGKIIDVRKSNSVPAAGANSTPVGQSTANTPLPPASWTSVGISPKLNWVVDKPITGANDPLGNPKAVSVSISADLSAMTQYAGSYNLRGVTQNGFKIGDLVGLTTGLDGVINARYSNGRQVAVAKLGVADFSDKNAMQKLGGMNYAESFQSGAVHLGSAQGNGFGTINSGSLEYSNVDTAGELVKMIQTQRTYQASAKVISTSQTLMQRILQL
jgi:flagellar hook protein FlgE